MYKPPISISSNIFSKPPLLTEIDSLRGCVNSFPKGTLCGGDNLETQHIWMLYVKRGPLWTRISYVQLLRLLIYN